MSGLRKWIKNFGKLFFQMEKCADFTVIFKVLGFSIKRFRTKAAYRHLQEEYKNLQERHERIQENNMNSLNHMQEEIRKIYENNKNSQMTFDEFISDYFLDRQCELVKNDKYPECIERELARLKDVSGYFVDDLRHNYLSILLELPEPTPQPRDFFNGDEEVYIRWEIERNVEKRNKISKEAHRKNRRVIIVGDSFLRSFTTFSDHQVPDEYRKGISFTLDDVTSYFDATRSSRLEQMLNDKELVITDEQKSRARSCIDKIVNSHLTKYNHQPIFVPKIGREGVSKVLVVDQSYGDMSVIKGMANEKTFVDMLQSAINENPDADIIVKTHPDTMTGRKGGYYTALVPHDNVYAMTEPINPISLIEYSDKVYVCSSQFGFEALMCGKEVHVFGIPFYAGWGLTTDKQKCVRRDNVRSLEEVFYLAYIAYSRYVNPQTKSQCEIEEAMDYLLELRNKFCL